jgi:hypothetical protein
VVIANCTTLTDDFPDRACILAAGDHPWLDHVSSMFYGRSRLFNAQNFPALLKAKTYQKQEDASEALIVRIRRGAVDSEFTPEDVRQAVLRCKWRPNS